MKIAIGPWVQVQLTVNISAKRLNVFDCYCGDVRINVIEHEYLVNGTTVHSSY